MKRRLWLAALVWESIVLAYVAAVIWIRSGRINSENLRVLAEIALAGLIVVLSCWPICRVLQKWVGALTGAAVGLAIPLVLGWMVGIMANRFQGSWGHFITPLESWILGLQISIPSAIAGAIVGFLQAKPSRERSAVNPA